MFAASTGGISLITVLVVLGIIALIVFIFRGR
jgi:hypothetical protein